jgi:hypothetical protein
MLRRSYNENVPQNKDLLINQFFLNDPTLFELYKRSLPPKDAYYYFPKGEEIIIFNNKKPEKSLRRIYTNVPYTEKEQNWLVEFKTLIAKHPENKIPDYWNDGLNLAFVYSTECQIEKAYKRMIDYLKWYNDYFPMNIQPEDKAIKLLNTGFTYVFGRDHQFRPIIICQPYILQKYEKIYSDEDVVSASILICQYMANYMLIQGQIENWIMFINVEKTSLLRLPDSIKKLVKSLSDYFIAKLYKSYILGMNGFLRIIFKILCSFLEEVTVKKFVILEGKKDPNLFQDINPQNLEERFGGQAQNCIYDEENCLFPPRMPSNDYLKYNENPKEIFITEEEYIERYNTGNIPPQSVSPFVIERIKKEKKKKEQDEIARKKREDAENKKNEAKTKSELNINTTWNTQNELFDIDKFQTSSDAFIDGINNFKNMKDKFCNNLITLNVHVSSENENDNDNDNFE